MSELDKIFTELKEDPPPPRRRRVGAKTESIALIASNGGVGCVLDCDGPGIEASLDDVGKALDDNGLDDAPDGLSIWEGHYATRRINSPDYGIDYDAELVGQFRDLTDQEWERLRVLGRPWAFVEDTEKLCTFCSKATKDVMVQNPEGTANICGECIEMVNRAVQK